MSRFKRTLERLSQAAGAIETGEFTPDSLSDLTKRTDEIGGFARAFEAMARQVAARDKRLKLLRVAIPIGIELSTEKDLDRLLERIVIEAQALCNADGGALYLRTDDDRLDFMILRNNSLDIAAGGTTGNDIHLPSMPLYDEETGEPNYHNVATLAALKNTQINIPDVYQVKDMDFSGTRVFDAQTGYRSTSFLTIPLEGEDQRVIGVLQLLNAQDPDTGQIVPFEQDNVIDSLVLLASAALQGYIREEHLRLKIKELRIEIDKVKRAEKVAEITETDYFQEL